MSNIDNTEDLLDSRDIIERIEELEGDRAALEEDVENAEAALADYIENSDDEDAENSTDALALAVALDEARKALAEWDESGDAEELKTLKDFAEDLEGYGDWEHGETLIRKSYFVEYVEDLLKDCGDLPKDIPWYICIDWEATARNIKIDYTEANFDGVTYYMRA